MVVLLVIGIVRAVWWGNAEQDRGIPFYSTADENLAREAMDLIRGLSCRDCHSLWGIRNPMQAVPAPRLDGIGSLRDEEWLYRYLSASNPQAILPSRLKKEYRMPSYAFLPESQRRVLARYLASLKVKAWYREALEREHEEKLSGKVSPR